MLDIKGKSLIYIHISFLRIGLSEEIKRVKRMDEYETLCKYAHPARTEIRRETFASAISNAGTLGRQSESLKN